jgi:hypothetical protein
VVDRNDGRAQAWRAQDRSYREVLVMVDAHRWILANPCQAPAGSAQREFDSGPVASYITDRSVSNTSFLAPTVYFRTPT